MWYVDGDVRIHLQVFGRRSDVKTTQRSVVFWDELVVPVMGMDVIDGCEMYDKPLRVPSFNVGSGFAVDLVDC